MMMVVAAALGCWQPAAAAAAAGRAPPFGAVPLHRRLPPRIPSDAAAAAQECTPTYLLIRGGGASASVREDGHLLDARSVPLAAAMAAARSEARLLVVYLPAKGKAAQKNNGIAAQSLRSDEVARAANRKQKKGERLGSFLVWSAERAGSAEVQAAMKQLKAKHPKKDSPVLLVAYVAQSARTGKLQAQVLAQHHGNPPPRPEAMAAWLSALRKRHGKQLAAMRHRLREVELYQERQKGYATSQAEDRDREVRAAREEKERLAKEEEERARLAALEDRRRELAESLPEEPAAGTEGVVTIALRFADGRRGQRRFEADEEMSAVFNWVDAMFALERERVELSTMTGQKRFVWNDVEEGGMTLRDTGLGKMTGLRVAEIEDDEDGDDDGEDEESDSEEESDEDED